MNKRSLMWRTPFHSCFGGVLVNFDQKSWHGCLLLKNRALRPRALRPIVVGRGQSSPARKNQMAHFRVSYYDYDKGRTVEAIIEDRNGSLMGRQRVDERAGGLGHDDNRELRIDSGWTDSCPLERVR